MSEMLCVNAGRACMVICVLVTVVSVCTFLMWRWALKLDLNWGMKRLFLMQWPRLLSGLGIIGLMFGFVGAVGQIAEMFFKGYSSSSSGYFGRCLRALVPLFWGGMVFFVAWFQYGIYRILISRAENRQVQERGDK